MSYPHSVELVDVSPRDGLQHTPQALPTGAKLALIDRLADAGLTRIAVAAFVSPPSVPQMADAAAVLHGLQPRPGMRYSVLVSNLKGFDAAMEADASEIAIFTAASDTFSRKHANASIGESLKRLAPVAAAAQALDVPVRGYIACVAGCPYEGPVAPAAVAALARELIEMGCYEVALGDTLGMGTPGSIVPMLEACLAHVPAARLAGHYHDTRGMAIANIHASLQLGIRVFDAAVAGLGGCPYAPGAAGNVASEDVLYLLQGLGIACDVDMDKLLAAGDFIAAQLGQKNGARLAQSRPRLSPTCQ